MARGTLLTWKRREANLSPWVFKARPQYLTRAGPQCRIVKQIGPSPSLPVARGKGSPFLTIGSHTALQRYPIV